LINLWATLDIKPEGLKYTLTRRWKREERRRWKREERRGEGRRGGDKRRGEGEEGEEKGERSGEE
jgi:hypothetical protein